jgi:ParB/Sulfiredoxin domain
MTTSKTIEEAVLDNSTLQIESAGNRETEERGTIFCPKKSQNGKLNTNLQYLKGDVLPFRLDELEIHPKNREIYPYCDEERIKNLADNIKSNGLHQKIIINKNHQIISGGLRYRALQYLSENKLMDVQTIEVLVINIEASQEDEFIISDNQQRVKNIFDIRNEVMILWEKISPGQGNRDAEETEEEKKERRNTVKEIARITGNSTSKISNIRRIDSTYPKFFSEIHQGNLTLNGALKKCELIEALENVGENPDEIEADEIEKKLNTSTIAYCTEHHPEYVDMLEKGKMNSIDVCRDLFKKNRTKRDQTSSNNDRDGRTDLLDDSTICPCCSGNVEDEKDIIWIKKHKQKIREYIIQLKF